MAPVSWNGSVRPLEEPADAHSSAVAPLSQMDLGIVETGAALTGAAMALVLMGYYTTVKGQSFFQASHSTRVDIGAAIHAAQQSWNDWFKELNQKFGDGPIQAPPQRIDRQPPTGEYRRPIRPQDDDVGTEPYVESNDPDVSEANRNVN